MAGNALVPELAVRDLEASLHFYREICGFSVLYRRPAEGFACIGRDGCELMLDQIGLGRTWETATLEPPLGRGMNLQLRVTGLDALLKHLDTAGVPLFLPLESRTYDVRGEAVVQRQFAVQDPDGYLLRFCAGSAAGGEP